MAARSAGSRSGLSFSGMIDQAANAGEPSWKIWIAWRHKCCEKAILYVRHVSEDGGVVQMEMASPVPQHSNNVYSRFSSPRFVTILTAAIAQSLPFRLANIQQIVEVRCAAYGWTDDKGIDAGLIRQCSNLAWDILNPPPSNSTKCGAAAPLLRPQNKGLQEASPRVCVRCKVICHDYFAAASPCSLPIAAAIESAATLSSSEVVSRPSPIRIVLKASSLDSPMAIRT